MNVEHTKQLIDVGINRDDPIASLVHVLESAIELVALPDNDFSWSYWEGSEEAIAEINSRLRLAPLRHGCPCGASVSWGCGLSLSRPIRQRSSA
jgi:hypothetical protein